MTSVKNNAAERIHLAMLLSVLGGVMDGYSYSVRGGVFALNSGRTGSAARYRWPNSPSTAMQTASRTM